MMTETPEKHWRNKTVVDLLYKHVYVIFTYDRHVRPSVDVIIWRLQTSDYDV